MNTYSKIINFLYLMSIIWISTLMIFYPEGLALNTIRIVGLVFLIVGVSYVKLENKVKILENK